MVKVKMKATAAGPEGTFMAGQVYSVEDKQAKDFVEGGYAEALEPFPDIKKPSEPEEGEVSEPDSDNPAGDGADDTDGSETAPKGRR